MTTFRNSELNVPPAILRKQNCCLPTRNITAAWRPPTAGVFDREISDYVRYAFAVRNDSDYKDFYLVSEEDARIQIENADTVIEAVRKYLSEKKS